MALIDKAPAKVADVMLPSAAGRPHSLRSALGRRPCLVVVFTSIHCPYAKAYFDVLPKLARSRIGRQAAFLLVGSNRSASRYPEGLITLRRQFATYPLPFVRDARGVLARALGPSTTPSACVMDRSFTLRYRGAIDDRFRSPKEWKEGMSGFWPWDGSRSWTSSTDFLLDAISSVLRGEVVTTKADEIGCAISL